MRHRPPEVGGEEREEREERREERGLSLPLQKD